MSPAPQHVTDSSSISSYPTFGASARVELACAQLGGVAVLRYVTRMEPVASMAVEELVAMVGPSVEATLHAPFRGAVGGGGQRRRGAMRRR